PEDGRAARERLECAALYEENHDAKTGEAEPVEALLGKNEGDGVCSLLYWDARKKVDLDHGYYYWGSKLTNARSTATVMGMEHAQHTGVDVPTCYGVAAELVFDPRRCLYDVPPGVIASALRDVEAVPRSSRLELARVELLLRLAN